jgi:hypothetical protein
MLVLQFLMWIHVARLADLFSHVVRRNEPNRACIYPRRRITPAAAMILIRIVSPRFFDSRFANAASLFQRFNPHFM